MADEDYLSDQFPDDYWGTGYFPDGAGGGGGGGAAVNWLFWRLWW